MLEHEEPVFFSRPLPQTALRLEGHERLEVVSHDPRQRKVRGGRADVREEAGGLVVAADEHGLVVRCVPRCGHDADPFRHISLSFDQVPKPRLGDRLEVLQQVTRPDTLVLAVREVEFSSLDDVPGIRKRRTDHTGLVPHRVAACVVEVEMRTEHNVDVGRIEARITDAVLQASRLPRIQYTVDVGELLPVFVADPRVDEYEGVGGLDEQAPERERR